MRQGQSPNRQRSRGRNNNRNRSNNNSNNINRSMESNGPDVRIRGTASTIAEKYQQLARDSHSAGDIVAAESYWQHAEHYNRLIAVAQAAQNQAREEQRVQQGNDVDNNRGENSDGDNRNRGNRNRSQNSDHQADSEQSAPEAVEAPSGSGPQPTLEETPAEVVLSEKPVNGADEDAAPKKPRKSRRPRKSASDDDGATIAAAETKTELPAFISGGEE